MVDHCKPHWFTQFLCEILLMLQLAQNCSNYLIDAVDVKKCPKQFYNDSTNIYICNENLNQ